MRLASRLLATASIATGVTAGSIIAPPSAAAAPGDDPLTATCELLGLPCDGEVLDGLVDEVLSPTTTIVPTTEPEPEPEPAPSDDDGVVPATGSTGTRTEASSASGAVGFSDPATSSGTAGAEALRGGSSGVPSVPVGGPLTLDPLPMPALGATPAVEVPTPSEIVEHLVAPATALEAEHGNGAKATAAVVAFGVLLLAAGLLLDQVRKARVPFRL